MVLLPFSWEVNLCLLQHFSLSEEKTQLSNLPLWSKGQAGAGCKTQTPPLKSSDLGVSEVEVQSIPLGLSFRYRHQIRFLDDFGKAL